MARGTSTGNGTERTRRTPAEIAQAELDKANARVEKATKRLVEAEAAVEPAKAELNRAERFRDYAKSNPDLPPESASDTAEAEAPVEMVEV